MTISIKRTVTFIAANPGRSQNHYQSYYPNLKIGETNPFARRAGWNDDTREDWILIGWRPQSFFGGDPFDPPQTGFEAATHRRAVTRGRMTARESFAAADVDICQPRN